MLLEWTVPYLSQVVLPKISYRWLGQLTLLLAYIDTISAYRGPVFTDITVMFH
ncbi:hypothetical protein J6590_091228, partial [Homalodisca vitripennis]